VAVPVAPGVDAVRAGGQHDETDEDEEQSTPASARRKDVSRVEVGQSCQS
jgi:hypothetical protein